METHQGLNALRSRWWLVLLGALLGASVGLGVSLLTTPTYTASTQLFVSTTNNTSSTDLSQGSQFSQERVASYALLIEGRELARRVIDELDLPMSPGALAERIDASAVTNTVLIDVTASDASPAQASAIANTVANEFIAYVSEIESTDGAGASPVNVTVTEPASDPQHPSAPRERWNTLVGLLAGLAVGALGALLWGYLDRSVTDAEEAARLGGGPVIGTVTRNDSLASRHVFDQDTDPSSAEDFRQIRNNLQFVNVDNPPRIVMVTSAVPSEGKTTLAINLAIALAEAGKRVTVVEADMRRPRMSKYLGLLGEAGLTSILAAKAEVGDVAQQYRHGVKVIVSGATPPNPGELLVSSTMASLLRSLRDESDLVIVDAPPLLSVADATGLAPYVDGVLLSIHYGRTRKDELRHAAAALERVSARTVGIILSLVPPNMTAGNGHRYGYGALDVSAGT